MNRTQAESIVRATFTAAFDKAQFLNLTRNLVNHLDESKAQAWNSQYVKDAFKEHVARYERLGTYTSPERETLDVLIVYLTRDSKLERARTAIRNFVADHLKTRDEKDAALVAFVSPSEQQWRFSYVKMEYATTETASGKVGVETKLTPARRFSYIVGAGEACHTAQTRFLDLLQDTATDPTLAQIEEAFSVEAVTKEFFTQYVELFEQIQKHLDKLVEKDKSVRDEFKSKNISTVDFAKKLLGQIVFLYFLQKKGWLGVARGKDWGVGPRDFMRRLARGEFGKYANFFDDILEPLFYESLAVKRDDDWCKRFNCRIPFLNGGLFEPIGDYDWRKTDIVIPNRLFTNNERVDEGVIGTGVFDVFDRYNFTVNEAEPLEKEVAIDPEMLGKVFENLIEENRRKGLGAFYTPREIVHYMCQESLINYLDTAINTRDEAVVPEKPQQSKMFGEPDPRQTALKMATHKEVVPRGDIETFVHLGEQISHYEAVPTEYRVKMPKNIEPNARVIDDALANITVCDPAVGSGAFPVGMMTEIVRARLALNSYLGDKKRTPYDFKRHAIQNCLYGVDIDAGAVEIAKLRLWLSLVVDEEDVKEIKPLPNLDYKIVAGNSLLGLPFKSQRLGKIEELKQKVFDETDHDKKAKIKAQVDEQLAQVFAASKKSLGYEATFDFQVFFSEIFQRKGGFDVMIANPPYVEHKKLKPISSTLKANFEVYSGTGDLYIYFFEKALKLLGKKGLLTFITSNKFIKTSYGRNLRGYLSKRNISEVIDFTEVHVFDALVSSSIILIRNSEPADEVLICFANDGLRNFANLDSFISNNCFAIKSSSLTPEIWQLEKQDRLTLKSKIEKAGRVLATFSSININRGVTTGYNPAFIVDGKRRQELIKEDESSKQIIKPCLQGRNIRKWYFEKSETHLINSGFDIDIPRSYPAIFDHLKVFRKELEIRADQGKHWWNLRSCTYYSEFEKEKIIWGLTADRWAFAYDDEKHYLPSNAYLLTSSQIPIKYILAILNSKLMQFYFGFVGIMTAGGAFTLKYETVREFPLVESSDISQKRFIAVVDQILVAKKRNPEADTSALEGEIDQLVYRLYGLTQEEIAVVEGK